MCVCEATDVVDRGDVPKRRQRSDSWHRHQAPADLILRRLRLQFFVRLGNLRCQAIYYPKLSFHVLRKIRVADRTHTLGEGSSASFPKPTALASKPASHRIDHLRPRSNQ